MRSSTLVIAVIAAAASGTIAWLGVQSGTGSGNNADRGRDIASLQRWTEAQPDSAEAWKLLAVAQRNAGRREDAIYAYIRAARLTPEDTEIILALRDLSAPR